MPSGSGGEYLGDAVLRLSTDSSKYDSGIKSAKDKAESLASGFKKTGAALTAVGLPFLLLAKQAINTADEFAKMSQKVGVSVETLSGLSFAANLAGTNIGTVERGLGLLSRNLDDYAGGVGEAKESFSFLGISAVDLEGNLRSTDKVLFEMADRFKEMPDGTKKTALAMDILGKSGKDLIPLLNEGSDGLRDMLDEAGALGQVLSTETAQSAERFNDSLERLKTSLGGVLNAIIASGFLDTLTSLATRTAEWVAGFTQAHPTLVKVGAAIGLVAAVLGPLLIALGFIIPILMGPVGIVIGLIAVVAAIGTFIASNETARSVISAVWNGIKSYISTAIGTVLGHYASMAGTISKIGLLPDAVQRKMASLSKSLKTGSERVLDFGKKTELAKKEIVPARKETEKFADAFTAPKIGLNPAMGEAEKKAKALKKEQDALKKSFADTINPSKDLGKKLKVLIDEFDREDVVNAHWKEIIKAKEESEKFKTELDPLVASMVAEAKALGEAETKAADLTKQLDKEAGLRAAFEDTINPSKELGLKLGILMDEFDREDLIAAHATEILAANTESAAFNLVLDPLVASMVAEAAALKTAATDAADLANQIAKEDGLRAAFAATIDPSNKLGLKLKALMDEFDRETVIAGHVTEILAAQTAAGTYKTALDPLVTSMVAEAAAIKLADDNLKGMDKTVEESTAAADLAAQWNTAMGTLSADISQSIVGIFTGEGSPLGKLGNAFKEFGKGALSSVVTLFVTPFQNALTGLLKGLAEKLTGFLTGGGGGGGILGGVLGGGGGGGGGILGGILGGGASAGAGAAGAAGAAGGGGGMLGGILGSANPAMMWAGAAGLVMMGIGAIGQLFKANKQKAIEENTRFSAIDLHGIRHGLATGEFFMQDWHIIAAINHVNETLVATLWSIRWQLVEVIPPKLDALLTSGVDIQKNMLAELQGIRTNTSELRGIVGAIRSATAAKAQSSRSTRGTIEDILEDAIRLGKGSLREVIAETARSAG